MMNSGGFIGHSADRRTGTAAEQELNDAANAVAFSILN
jgi:hypothetical protein